MSIEEYNETKEETLEQFQELNISLSKLKEGNLSLIDDVNSMQLAIQGKLIFKYFICLVNKTRINLFRIFGILE